MAPRRRTAAVLGGSVAGAATALHLARAGHQVTLVDPALPHLLAPGAAPRTRAGAPQTVHAHGFGSRTQVELSTRLPDVWQSLLDAGARPVPLADMAPPELYDGGRPGDEDITALQVRRHVFDRVLVGAAAAEERVRMVAEPVAGLSSTSAELSRSPGG